MNGSISCKTKLFFIRYPGRNIFFTGALLQEKAGVARQNQWYLADTQAEVTRLSQALFFLWLKLFKRYAQEIWMKCLKSKKTDAHQRHQREENKSNFQLKRKTITHCSTNDTTVVYRYK